MSNYPFLKIHTCSDDVDNVDYLDIDYYELIIILIKLLKNN